MAEFMIFENILERNDFRVLITLMTKLDFENLVEINQSEIARALGVSRQSIGRGIKNLIALGILIKGAKIGTCCSYRLNPDFIWNDRERKQKEISGRDFRERLKASNIQFVIYNDYPAAINY